MTLDVTVLYLTLTQRASFVEAPLKPHAGKLPVISRKITTAFPQWQSLLGKPWRRQAPKRFLTNHLLPPQAPFPPRSKQLPLAAGFRRKLFKSAEGAASVPPEPCRGSSGRMGGGGWGTRSSSLRAGAEGVTTPALKSQQAVECQACTIGCI